MLNAQRMKGLLPNTLKMSAGKDLALHMVFTAYWCDVEWQGAFEVRKAAFYNQHWPLCVSFSFGGKLDGGDMRGDFLQTSLSPSLLLGSLGKACWQEICRCALQHVEVESLHYGIRGHLKCLWQEKRELTSKWLPEHNKGNEANRFKKKNLKKGSQ